MGKKLTYKDEKGNILFGFSQLSLDDNTKAIQELVNVHKEKNNQRRIFIAMALVLFFVFLLALYAAKKDHFFNTLVQRCLR